MGLYKNKAGHKPAKCFVTLFKDPEQQMQYVRSTGKALSVLDQDGRIVEEVTPQSRIFPLELSNEQICERALIEGIEQIGSGMNMTVLYVGASFSGKEKLNDGNKAELPLSSYFIDRLYSHLKKKGRNVEYRAKMITIINEKVFDCFSESKAHIKVREDKWEGVEPPTCRSVPFQSANDLNSEFSRAIKQKTKLVLEHRDLYSTIFTVQIIQKSHDGRDCLVSKLNFVEIPGVESMVSSHSLIKIKQSSSSTRSLIGFSNLVNEMSKHPDCMIHYESSQLTHLLKEVIGANSTLYCFLTLKVSDIDGSMSSLRFLRPLENLEQHPLINDSLGFGMIKKYRHWAMQNNLNDDSNLNEEKKVLEEQMLRLQTEQDYKKLLENYSELKQKYATALKAKSEAQLQLIKCEEEKLQIGKALVEIQIQNTKLLQKLQNKDYENGKKILNAQNLLAQREMSYQECLDKINELNQGLNDALQGKRDLEVEFIALKRNFLLQQKQLKQLKEDNQNLSLDVINLTKQNEKLKKSLMQGQKMSKSRFIAEMQMEKYEEQKRANQQLQETINYLKSEIQRYKKELLQYQMAEQGLHPKNGDDFGKDYRRIQLENQNMELQNRHRLNLRKIEELEQKIGYLAEENQSLEQELRQMKIQDHQQTQQYRENMQRFTKNTNQEVIVKQLKQNFNRKDSENLDKINSLKRDVSEKKRQIINLKSYIRELLALLEEWGPKGMDIPGLKKYESLDLTTDKNIEEIEELRIKNIRLEQELRRIKQASNTSFRESRVIQQYDYLKNNSKSELQKLRQEKNQLGEQNRRLMTLLKDGRKMDMNVVQKENENLKRELEHLKNSASISPSTNDQKIKFYQKHIKQLEKERSELLSRCVMAQEQLKNVLSKVGKNRN